MLLTFWQTWTQNYLRFDKREHIHILGLFFLNNEFFLMKRKGLETIIPQYERKILSLSIYKEYENKISNLYDSCF